MRQYSPRRMPRRFLETEYGDEASCFDAIDEVKEEKAK